MSIANLTVVRSSPLFLFVKQGFCVSRETVLPSLTSGSLLMLLPLSLHPSNSFIPKISLNIVS